MDGMGMGPSYCGFSSFFVTILWFRLDPDSLRRNFDKKSRVHWAMGFLPTQPGLTAQIDFWRRAPHE
jgi:hypothetical protein